MKSSASIVAGVLTGFLVHKKIDWAMLTIYNKYPTYSRFIIGVSVGMGLYFLTQELPRLTKKIRGGALRAEPKSVPS
jgi:hypothetical protein